jgi:hypothetical protein
MLSQRHTSFFAHGACNDNGRVSVARTEARPAGCGVLAAAVPGGCGFILTYVADGVSIISKR